MSGPPTDIEASELWTLLESMPRPSEAVDFPRKLPGTNEPVGQIRIWVLTQQEQIACAAEADRAVKSILKEKQQAGEENLAYRDAYQNEVTVQVLWRACRDVANVEKPAFPSPKHIRKLTVDEISVLARHYLQTQTRLGPIVAWLTAEEEKAWIERLAVGGSAIPLGLLSPGAQEALMLSMASQLHASWMAMSSAGSQQDEPSTATNDGAAS